MPQPIKANPSRILSDAEQAAAERINAIELRRGLHLAGPDEQAAREAELRLLNLILQAIKP